MYTDSGHLSARTLMSDEPSCSNVLDPQLPRCAWLLACSVSRKDASPQSSASARRIPVRILSGNGVHRFRNHCSTSPEYAPVQRWRLSADNGVISTSMPAGICIISIVKCLQYINLGISDFFRISPRHRVVVFNGFVVVTTRGLRYLLVS